MPKIRKDITNDDVVKLLEKFEGNITMVARYLGCSRSLVRSVKNDTRKDTKKYKVKEIDKDKLCCFCKEREKAPGHRYLCEKCYKEVAPYYEEFFRM